MPMDNLVPRIAAAVHASRDELISFLRQLVQTPSLPGREQQAQRLVADKMRALGLTVDFFKKHLG